MSDTDDCGCIKHQPLALIILFFLNIGTDPILSINKFLIWLYC